MGLQVWLPLNRDLRNQGLDNVTVTNYGATFNSAGKLGGCYKTSSTAIIDLGYNGNQVNTGSISFGGWFNFNKAEIWSAISGKSYNSSANAATGCLIGNNSYNGVSLQWFTNNIYTSNSLTALYVQGYLRSSTNGARATNGFSLPFGTWVHIYFTFDKVSNIMTLYVNGENKYTYTNVAFSDARSYNLFINLNSIAGGNGPSASIPFLVNDVRIYNHCLSPMEVKKLSKGLVLHYPLNRGGWGQENLLKVNCCSGGNRATFLENGRRVKINWTSNAADTYWYLGLASGVTLTEGKTYTLSFQCSGLGSNTVSFRWCNLANYEAYLKNGLNTFTFAMPSTSITNPFFDDINRDTSLSDLELWNFKLEEGSIATPWCPSSSDALATTMGLNGTIEYDISGFQNNGTRNGSFDWDSNKPKYNCSMAFNGSNNSVQTPDLTTMVTDKNYTIACWFYKDSIGSKNYQTIYGGPSGFELEARNGGGTDPQLVGWNWGKPVASYTFGVWHHFAFVHTDSDCKIYLDGEYVSTGSSVSIPSGNYFIGAWRDTSSQNYEGKISDFRIYATALSAFDIRSLYQNN